LNSSVAAPIQLSHDSTRRERSPQTQRSTTVVGIRLRKSNKFAAS
jgi:hypothetical protein